VSDVASAKSEKPRRQKRKAFHHKGTKIYTKGHKEDRKQSSKDRDQKAEV
jgi:hypothetical protein